MGYIYGVKKDNLRSYVGRPLESCGLKFILGHKKKNIRQKMPQKEKLLENAKINKIVKTLKL